MPKASRNTRLCEGNACGASAAYADSVRQLIHVSVSR